MSRELLTAQPWCARFLYNVHCNVLQFRGLFSHLNTIHFFSSTRNRIFKRDFNNQGYTFILYFILLPQTKYGQTLFVKSTKKIGLYCDTFIYSFSKYGSIYSFIPTSKILNMEYFVYHDGRHLLITLNGCEVEWVSSASPIHMINTSYNTVLSNQEAWNTVTCQLFRADKVRSALSVVASWQMALIEVPYDLHFDRIITIILLPKSKHIIGYVNIQ